MNRPTDPVPDAVPGPVDVVLPCLDKTAALPGLLAALPPGFQPLVVDNGNLSAAYRTRTGGRSTVSGSVRGTLRAARDRAAVLA